MESLNALEKNIITNGEYYTQLAITSYNRNKDVALEPFETEFQKRLNDDLLITDAFFKDWSMRARNELVRNGVKPSDVERFIAAQREEANKSYNRNADDNVDTDPDVYGEIRQQLNLGLDQAAAIDRARKNKQLSFTEYKELLKANADETDFEKNVMNRPAVRERSESIQNQFSDVPFKNGIAIPGFTGKKTNVVKRMTGLDIGLGGSKDRIVPQETLDALGADALQMFREAMRLERQSIVDANPDITRPELDRELSKRVAEVYEQTFSNIEEVTMTKLRTGMYGLGLKKEDFSSVAKAKSDSPINIVFNKLGLTDATSQATFIFEYNANNF